MDVRQCPVAYMEIVNRKVLFGGQYQDKRVLVTGHTGFKGSWLSVWLLELGATVCGLSIDVPTTPSHFDALNLSKFMTDLRGDIRNFQEIQAAIQKESPDIVFHLAAQPIVQRGYTDPRLTFETNMAGTLNVLEACRLSASVQSLVIVTSDKAYRNMEWEWGYRESDSLGGDDPYSASKGAAELVCRSYSESFLNEMPRMATARAGNVIGGGDWSLARIIPDCVRAWADGQTVTIRSPRSTRPWQHVLEPLSGYLCLGAELLQSERYSGESFNFGPDAKVIQSVSELLHTFSNYWENALWKIDTSESSQTKEHKLLKLCCDKALVELGWHAALDFNDTIQLTAEWYKGFYGMAESATMDLTIAQISEYVTKAAKMELSWVNTSHD